MPTTGFEDDSLLDHEYGITDIVKLPRPFGQEPSREEYEAGSNRILKLIRIHRPKVVVFVYKKVLDEVSRLEFGIQERSNYGFNPTMEPHFGARVFAFPLPGTPCTKAETTKAMRELAACVLANENPDIRPTGVRLGVSMCDEHDVIASA